MKFAIYEINLSKTKTPEDYYAAISTSPVHYYDTLADAQKYCGGTLRRQRAGYSGTKGNIEYIVTKA